MTASAQGQANPPVNLPGAVEVHRDVSPRLRDMEPKIPPRGPAHPIPLLHPTPGTGPGSLYVDPALQTTLGPSVSTNAGLGFDGVGEGFHGYSVNVAPPDTNGAVGDHQYVQWVNLSFAVFDKTSGSLVYGPAAGNTIWSGFGGACQSTNDGDVIAQYDKQANRWVMAQLSYSQAPPYLLCLAVSTSDDATGSYYRYSFSYSGNLNDYPKLGIWPDGYYVTANMFKPRGFFGYTYQGPEVCAFDRNSMLNNGGPSNPVCKTLSSSYSSLLPADLDGTNLPSTIPPNYLLGLGGSSSLYLWKFKPNFSSGTSTLSGPTTIPVASYNLACGGGTCIPQSGTSQQLDSLGDRLMYRLAYRYQGGTEILLANHSVATTVGGNTSTVGIRWYEIHNPNGTPTVYQQSTWAPDATYRWMGSLAMDKVGNIALGYSTSSSTSNPSISYTGRQPSDGLGVMEAENNIIVGTGSQQVNLARWGDYSSMSVDPVDDCTFWYTTEYLKTNGTFNWSTRVASFSFPSCTGAGNPPTASIHSPAAGTEVSGTVLIQISASDVEDAAGSLTVKWNVDGGTWQSATYNNSTSYYEASWNSGGVSDGNHTINAQATDSDSQTGSASTGVVVNNVNDPPTASFTFSCTGLSCNFNGSGSSDSDGSISSYTWNFGDGTANASGVTPSHTYSAAGTFAVTLTVTDNGGATGSQSKSVTVNQPAPITLTASGYKVKGLQKADLSWSGATSTNVDVYRNGGKIWTTPNTGSYTDSINNRGSGSYTYKVCESGGTTTCSNDATVTF